MYDDVAVVVCVCGDVEYRVDVDDDAIVAVGSVVGGGCKWCC